MIVGIDISKDWFDTAWLVSDQLCSQRFPYTDEGMEQLLKQAPAEAVFREACQGCGDPATTSTECTKLPALFVVTVDWIASRLRRSQRRVSIEVAKKAGDQSQLICKHFLDCLRCQYPFAPKL